MTRTPIDEIGAEPPREALVLRFASFAGGFWRGPSSRMAFWLTISLATGLIGKLFVDVGMNRWNRWFFDALERRDTANAAVAAFAFPLLVVCVAAVGVWIIRARESLQVRWREWCTARLLDRWLGAQRFYRMRIARNGLANPEYRISDDVRMATEPLADFAIGLFTALLTASTFVVILWTVGGGLDLKWGEGQYHVPAFMVIGALAYGLIVSAFMPMVGGQLSAAAAAKNEAEARFRFEMIRMRETAEAIMLTQGETRALQRLGGLNTDVAAAWMRVVAQHAKITWLTNGNTALAPVFPLVLAAPKYLAGQLTLGEVMQLASAFVQVQIAVGWLVDNYSRLAEWFASARRIVELIDALECSEGEQQDGRKLLSRSVSDDGRVTLDHVMLTRPSGDVVIHGANASFAPGDRVCVSGAAGIGKSTMMRAIAGLWLWGEGTIQAPASLPIAYVGSNPHLQAGRLSDVLCFPDDSDAYPAAHCLRALTSCGAGHLADRLAVNDHWDHVLSASEKQRVALARLMITQPHLVLLEDAMSCFGAAEQIALFDLLASHLPQAILITIGGAAGLADLHSRRFVLERNPAGEVHLTERGADLQLIGREAVKGVQT